MKLDTTILLSDLIMKKSECNAEMYICEMKMSDQYQSVFVLILMNGSY